MSKRAPHRPPVQMPSGQRIINQCMVCNYKAGFGREMAKGVADGQIPDANYSGYVFGFVPQDDGSTLMSILMSQNGKLVGAVAIPVAHIPGIMQQMFAAVDANDSAKLELEKSLASLEASERLASFEEQQASDAKFDAKMASSGNGLVLANGDDYRAPAARPHYGDDDWVAPPEPLQFPIRALDAILDDLDADEPDNVIQAAHRFGAMAVDPAVD